MTFSEAYSLTYDKELAIKLMEADASQRKSEALASILEMIIILVLKKLDMVGCQTHLHTQAT